MVVEERRARAVATRVIAVEILILCELWVGVMYKRGGMRGVDGMRGVKKKKETEKEGNEERNKNR